MSVPAVSSSFSFLSLYFCHCYLPYGAIFKMFCYQVCCDGVLLGNVSRRKTKVHTAACLSARLLYSPWSLYLIIDFHFITCSPFGQFTWAILDWTATSGLKTLVKYFVSLRLSILGPVFGPLKQNQQWRSVLAVSLHANWWCTFIDTKPRTVPALQSPFLRKSASDLKDLFWITLTSICQNQSNAGLWGCGSFASYDLCAGFFIISRMPVSRQPARGIEIFFPVNSFY